MTPCASSIAHFGLAKPNARCDDADRVLDPSPYPLTFDLVRFFLCSMLHCQSARKRDPGSVRGTPIVEKPEPSSKVQISAIGSDRGWRDGQIASIFPLV